MKLCLLNFKYMLLISVFYFSEKNVMPPLIRNPDILILPVQINLDVYFPSIHSFKSYRWLAQGFKGDVALFFSLAYFTVENRLSMVLQGFGFFNFESLKAFRLSNSGAKSR